MVDFGGIARRAVHDYVVYKITVSIMTPVFVVIILAACCYSPTAGAIALVGAAGMAVAFGLITLVVFARSYLGFEREPREVAFSRRGNYDRASSVYFEPLRR